VPAEGICEILGAEAAFALRRAELASLVRGDELGTYAATDHVGGIADVQAEVPEVLERNLPCPDRIVLVVARLYDANIDQCIGTRIDEAIVDLVVDRRQRVNGELGVVLRINENP